MKVFTILLLLSAGSVFGQVNGDKDKDFLRNYKAPDFKLKQLDLKFAAQGSSINSYGYKNNYFGENTDLYYAQYSNSQKYQGNLSANFLSNINWSKGGGSEKTFTATSVYFSTQNRFYFKPKWFVGVHGFVNITHTYSNQTAVIPQSVFGGDLVPLVSIGNGRLEPIQYARNAMDIEKLLSKGNRLSKSYSIGELTVIADKIAEINNVRYFDYRLRRIEQFEALDKTMQTVGGVSEFDITYFAYLADAYLYAKNFVRYSGFRQELGILPIGGFYKMNYDIPASYAVQHNFNANVLGADYYQNSLFTGFDVAITGGYELGLYPTTRTNFNAGIQVGTSLVNQDFGATLYTNSYVYLSPRFRLSFEANINVGTGTVATDMNYFFGPESVAPNGHNFNGKVGLSYAIF
ncbi:hypothetical protein DNU06_01630 [Putridiphycobacter roseus]|uniref:DUF5723 domain-containing protein n=1 Tax=Putridiphycobacter roseus TaxID=2219161 RepID=A0A2W1N1Q1_9FLAO|nr:hypothetical protein [Putridiphycobacter roseus]PZE18559.1 hypothetical protein DNU06_01630 [Putridiphycobacter roseus]